MTCQFVDGAKNTFSLQDGLGYAEINEFKGLYLIPDKTEIEKGIIYLADAVKSLFNKIDLSDSMNFQNIYQYRVEMKKKLLDGYYFENDVKKAEECWGKGEYDKAQELNEKHFSSLSKAQRKKLDYIKNTQRNE